MSWSVDHGTGSAVINNSLLFLTKAGTVTVMATKAGNSTYNEAYSAPMTITIGKLQVSGEPSYTLITTSGKTLADANLRNDENWNKFSSSIGWVDADGNSMPDSTPVQPNTEYTWKLRLDKVEEGNCEPMTLTGTVTLWTRSSSGGSSSPIYAVSLPETEHRTVKVSPRYAERGDTVTITVTPDSGYTLEMLTVLDRNGKKIELIDKGNGKFTFKMPASKVTVTFAEDNSMLNFFVDVTADKYYYDAVLWAAKKGITGGTSAITFGPHDSCTRAQLVTFLYRYAQSQDGGFTGAWMFQLPFSDVPEWCYEAVAWCYMNNIVGGYGNGLFGSNDTITREQMAVILYRFAQKTGLDTTQGGMAMREYSDYESISDYAVTAMQWAVNAGILQGYNNNLMPGQSCTRAQIVTMLYRLLGK